MAPRLAAAGWVAWLAVAAAREQRPLQPSLPAESLIQLEVSLSTSSTMTTRATVARDQVYYLRQEGVPLAVDKPSFLEGLSLDGGIVYRSNGIMGHSGVTAQRLQDGAPVADLVALPQTQFGEGLTVLGDRVFQLTWKDRKVYVYQLPSMALLETKTHPPGGPKEGWGLTNDGMNLIVSDGSESLFYLDPSDLSVVKTLSVADANGMPVGNLNELEMVNGEILANFYQTNCIARISPANGRVLGWAVLPDKMYTGAHQGVDAFNGIAYDAQSKDLYVSGKMWKELYRVSMQPLTSLSQSQVQALFPNTLGSSDTQGLLFAETASERVPADANDIGAVLVEEGTWRDASSAVDVNRLCPAIVMRGQEDRDYWTSLQ